MVLVSLKGSDLGADLFPVGLAGLRVTSDVAGSNRDLLANSQTALQDGTACNTTSQGLSVLSWLVDIEGPNHDHVGGNDELTSRNGNSAQVVDNHVNVILQLRGDRNDGCRLAASRGETLLNFFVLLLALGSVLVLHHNVDLVLEHNNVFQLHDVHGDQVFTGLRLGVRLVTGYEQQGRVHNRGSGKHGRHEGIVTRAIHKGNVSVEHQFGCAAVVVAHHRVSLRRAERLKALGRRASRALEKLCVSVTKLDRNVTEFLTEVAHSLHSNNEVTHHEALRE